MKQGISLVELMIAMTAASLLVLAVYHLSRVSSAIHTETRDAWFCMQSIRNASIQLNDDLTQCACLLPQDLKVAVRDRDLFIAGLPATSNHRGIQPSSRVPPPYYALIVSAQGHSMVLDTVDIDSDGTADFWADLGIITEGGPCTISHGYSRGGLVVPVIAPPPAVPGGMVIPAVHYELKSDGLYRNNQLLAEAIHSFEPRLVKNELVVMMRARYHGTEKELSIPYPLQ